MSPVTVDQTEINVEQLVNRVVHGEIILLAKDGKAIARVTPVVERVPHPRLGFLKGKGTLPANWKDIGREEIEREFYGED